VTNTATAAHNVAEAHARLRARSDIQFDLPVPTPSPIPTPTPEAHNVPLNFGAFGTFLFWAVIAVVVCFVLWMIIRAFQGSRVSRDATADPAQEVAAWRPEERVARALLAEADAMAAEGRL
jgi:flagellar biosynthesis/type III secretory pathway M-ring protein FliF/YscJ